MECATPTHYNHLSVFCNHAIVTHIGQSCSTQKGGLPMHFDIFTLFPDMFQGPFSESILKRAQERGLLSIALHNIRDAATDKHHVVDDYPYGGGAGMVMKPDPIFAAVEAGSQAGPIILLTPPGPLFTHQLPPQFSPPHPATLICLPYSAGAQP